MQTTSETSKRVNGALSTGASEFKGAADTAMSSLEKVSNDIGRQAGEMVSRFGEKSQDYYKVSEDYVKSNPAKGVAIAAGAGLLVGGLLAVALRRKH